ncbi:4Fe-4S binding protein [Gemmatimonadota bacterium]
MKKNSRQRPKSSLLLYLFVIAALLLSSWYGRTRSAPDIWPHLKEIYPEAASFSMSDGMYAVDDDRGKSIGWASTGSGNGYGGPLQLLVGIDTSGTISGTSVIEHRETPVFWRMVRFPVFFTSIAGTPFEDINYRYEEIVGVTGATRSSDAIVASVRQAVAEVAGEQFDTVIPLPLPPWEFGFFEIAIMVLFAGAVASLWLRQPMRKAWRWGSQAFALILLGFWENSPITLTKLTGFLAGYFPEISTNLAIYLLVAGFVLTVLFFGRSLYCSHLCPFGAIQRFINLIGGKRIRLPVWSLKLMRIVRDIIVLCAVLAALAFAQPGLAHYEPFAALFSLKGSMLQWFLLLIVLLLSLVLDRPWCNFMCPMRTGERVLQDIRSRITRPGGEEHA